MATKGVISQVIGSTFDEHHGTREEDLGALRVELREQAQRLVTRKLLRLQQRRARAVVVPDEHELVEHALAGLATIDGLQIIGPDTAIDRGATISFTLAGIHPHDVAQMLDEYGIAVRAGHHCARPVCVRYGIPATTRASFGIYTTTEEIDALVAGVEKVKEVFGG